MFQRPGNQTVQVVVKQRPGCFGIGCGGIIGLIALLVVIGAVMGNSKATPTPGTTFAASIATATTAPIAQTTVASSPSVATVASTAAPLAATPTPAAAPQIVTVKEDAVNLRQSADVAAAVVTLVPPGTDVTVIGEDTTGPDGVTRYVHARVGDKEGYLRSDLVSEHHDGVATTPTPLAVAIVPTTIVKAPVSSGNTSSVAVYTWLAKNGSALTSLQSDTAAIGTAADNQSIPAMTLACQRLATDVKSAQRLDPIPDPTVSVHFSASLRYLASGAQDCVVGTTTLDVATLQRATAEFNLAAAELQSVNDAIGKIPH